MPTNPTLSDLWGVKELVFTGSLLVCMPVTYSLFGHLSNFTEQYQNEAPEGVRMPQGADFKIGISAAFTICTVRYLSSFLFRPLGGCVLSKNKRCDPDRVDRFASVLFKCL